MSSTWIELRLDVPETDAEALGPLDELCLQISPGGFAVEGADAPPGDDAPPAAGSVRYKLYVGAPEVEAARATLSAALGRYPGAALTTAPLPKGWRDRWKAFFEPVEPAPGVWVAPPWHVARVKAAHPEALVLDVEPGLAFGTAQHPTTQLCLRGIAEHVAAAGAPARLLDVGCGTGILAVAGVRLGIADAVAVDVDPQAARATDENAVRNGVADRVAASTTPVARVEGRFPLVLANIMAHILIPMAPALAARTAPGGVLMLSGVLAGEQEADVRAAYAAQGFTWRHTENQHDWVRIDLSAPTP